MRREHPGGRRPRRRVRRDANRINGGVKIFALLILAVIIFAVWFFGFRGSQAYGDYFFVTLTVRADNLLGNMHLLDEDSHELVPSNGIIFPLTEVRAFEGDTVFDVLSREMRNAEIHMVSRQVPVIGSVYIEGINNIFEFDAGPLSGWKYRVNGEFPGFSVSSFALHPGDDIELLYTLDLGRDLGYEG